MIKMIMITIIDDKGSQGTQEGQARGVVNEFYLDFIEESQL